MSEQALDLRRSLLIVWRHKIMVGIAGAIGLAAGVAFTVHSPPQFSSSALVELPPSVHTLATQVVIASSDDVLAGAHQPGMSLQTLRSHIQVKGVTSAIFSISAQGETAAQAKGIANAVAHSYAVYVNSPNRPGGRVAARVLEQAISATRASLPSRLIINGGLGALIGLLVGAIVALAITHRDRRLRQRDDIAGAIGVPVLASFPVAHPSDAAGWTKLLDGYKPGVVHAWGIRKGLQHLGLADVRPGSGASLAVLSLSSDPGALALGPQLAVYAASLGIATVLVIGPQQDENVTATLQSACAGQPSAESRRSRRLWVSVGDNGGLGRQPDAALTIVVSVVNPRSPQVVATIPTATTVLGVSAGAVTAEELARVAISAAADGRDIAGILVADPDPADNTTGRIPELARSGQRRMPNRVTGVPRQIRR
jgi:capsular polysaccharide biosynthesis protein